MNSKKYLDEVNTTNIAFKIETIKKVGFFDEKIFYSTDVDIAWTIT